MDRVVINGVVSEASGDRLFEGLVIGDRYLRELVDGVYVKKMKLIFMDHGNLAAVMRVFELNQACHGRNC